MKLPKWLPRRRRPAVQGPVQAMFSAVEQRAGSVDDYFAFNGVAYTGTPTELMQRGEERGSASYAPLASILGANSVVYAIERLRVAVFTEILFAFQDMNDGRPGALSTTPATRLGLLANPFGGASTTADLLARLLIHADFGGNAYVVRSRGSANEVRLLRPDWVTLLLGVEDPVLGSTVADPNDYDVKVIACAYWPGGIRSGVEPDVFLADEVAHFAPMPDPSAHYRGMSWIQSCITEVDADGAATAHKAQFFRNGATAGAVVFVDKDMDENAFARFMAKFNARTKGVENAYRTWFVTGGVDAKTLGADFRQLDFKVTQGAGETRIAAAAGTPPILVGLSEGLSAGQYNIYSQAKRSFVDGTVRPLWRNLCGSLLTLVTPPAGKRLWYDDRDIAYLREDQHDQAEIFQLNASAVETLIRAGFKPDDVLKAVSSGDLLVLLGAHTGLFSVQLQPPGTSGTMTDPAQLPNPVDGQTVDTVKETLTASAGSSKGQGVNGKMMMTAPKGR